MDKHAETRGRYAPRIKLKHPYHLIAEGAGPRVEKNPRTASEALRLLRLYSSTGLTVYVRDRAFRQAYLSPAELEERAKMEADNADRT